MKVVILNQSNICFRGSMTDLLLPQRVSDRSTLLSQLLVWLWGFCLGYLHMGQSVISPQEGTWWQLPSPIDPTFVQAESRVCCARFLWRGRSSVSGQGGISRRGGGREWGCCGCCQKAPPEDVQEGQQQSWANQDTHPAKAEEQEALGNWQNPPSSRVAKPCSLAASCRDTNGEGSSAAPKGKPSASQYMKQPQYTQSSSRCLGPRIVGAVPDILTRSCKPRQSQRSYFKGSQSLSVHLCV